MTSHHRRATSALFVAAAVTVFAADTSAHSGPPYPVVSNRVDGPYRISVWTDPDATDDGTPGGQFWVMLETVAHGPVLTADTEVQVAIESTNGRGSSQTGTAAPENGDAARQFIALLMDHEGLFRVDVTIRGPLGNAQVSADVEATYDLRPPPFTLVLYLMPFLAVGALWLKMLVRRRRTSGEIVR
jgi:hypothetical protein